MLTEEVQAFSLRQVLAQEMGGFQVSETNIFSSRSLQVESYCLSESLLEAPGEEFFEPLGSLCQDYTGKECPPGPGLGGFRLLRIPQAKGAKPLCFWRGVQDLSLAVNPPNGESSRKIWTLGEHW